MKLLLLATRSRINSRLPSDRSRSGSRTGGWSGRRTTGWHIRPRTSWRRTTPPPQQQQQQQPWRHSRITSSTRQVSASSRRSRTSAITYSETHESNSRAFAFYVCTASIRHNGKGHTGLTCLDWTPHLTQIISETFFADNLTASIQFTLCSHGLLFICRNETCFPTFTFAPKRNIFSCDREL